MDKYAFLQQKGLHLYTVLKRETSFSVRNRTQHKLISWNTSDRLPENNFFEMFFPHPEIPSKVSCCLSLPICCLNTMLLQAHQPRCVSRSRREVKRLFQLLSYWLGPPPGKARPSVNPAHNERRSLPTETVSLWVYVMCLAAAARQTASAGGLCVWPRVCAACLSVEMFSLYLTFLRSQFHTHTHIILSHSLSFIWTQSMTN